jgi:hypothetical protein
MHFILYSVEGSGHSFLFWMTATSQTGLMLFGPGSAGIG